jgi:RNA polymerase sigma factor (sigma-70 family)
MDEEAFYGFVEADGPRLRNLAVALCRNTADADDLLQATLEVLYRDWVKRDRIELTYPYAYARKSLIRQHVSLQRKIRCWIREPVERVSSTSDPSQETGERLALFAALRQLPPRQREAVVLRYLEDMSVAEVSDLMQCAEGNVKRLTHDALRSLRRSLDRVHDPIGRI